MAPNQLAAAGGVGGGDKVGAADFIVALRAELGDDEVALLVVDEKPVAMLNEEGVSPAALGLGDGGKGFPHAFAGGGLNAAMAWSCWVLRSLRPVARHSTFARGASLARRIISGPL